MRTGERAPAGWNCRLASSAAAAVAATFANHCRAYPPSGVPLPYWIKQNPAQQAKPQPRANRAAPANDTGKGAVLFYLLAYAVTNLGAFGIITLLDAVERPNDQIRDYAGKFRIHRQYDFADLPVRI